MNATEFKKLVTKYFSPKIRELGWKGSGFHFRKPEKYHVVKIFGIQGNWYGGSVICETAIHFDFIPDLAGNSFSKTTYASCIIRERLSPKGAGDYHWKLGDKENENIETINEIWAAFEQHGTSFYNDFKEFPHPFDSIDPSDLNKRSLFGLGRRQNYRILGKYHIPNEIHLIWLLKEIHWFLGNTDRCKSFAELGLEVANQHATEMAKNSNGTLDQDLIKLNRQLFELP